MTSSFSSSLSDSDSCRYQYGTQTDPYMRPGSGYPVEVIDVYLQTVFVFIVKRASELLTAKSGWSSKFLRGSRRDCSLGVTSKSIPKKLAVA